MSWGRTTNITRTEQAILVQHYVRQAIVTSPGKCRTKFRLAVQVTYNEYAICNRVIVSMGIILEETEYQ